MKRSFALVLPFLVLASFAFAGTPGSVAQPVSPPNKVVDYQTVAGMLNPDGSVNEVRLLDDLRLFGSGDVKVTSPNSTEGVRNLLGLPQPQTVGDAGLRYSVDNLDGTTRYQTMTTVPDAKAMPLTMDVKYTLDGTPITGTDLVGKTGDIGMSFTVHNVSSKLMPVTYVNSKGEKLTKPMQVPLPIIGQLQVTLPPDHFTNIDSPLANVANDPFGNKILAFSFVLFPPLGDLDQTVTIEAQATDFALGQIMLAGMPVAPKSRPELNYAEISLSQGSDQASELVNGANLISYNLTKVYAGTAKLIAGLEKLYKGALKLSAGLSGAIAPGGQLMGGIDTMKSSLQKLADGVKGNGPALAAGVKQLDAGLAQMQGCLIGDEKACLDPSTGSRNPSIANIVTQLNAGLTFCLRNNMPGMCSLPTGQQQPIQKSANWIKDGPLPWLGGPGGVTGCLEDHGADLSCYGKRSVFSLAVDALATPGCSGDAACAAYLNDLRSSMASLRDGVLRMVQDITTTTEEMYKVFVVGYGRTPGALAGIKQITEGVSSGIGSATPSEVAACAKDSSKCSVRTGLALMQQQIVGGFGSDTPAAINACLADQSKCTLLSGVGAIINGLGQLQTGLSTGIGEAATGAGTLATCIGDPGAAPCQGNPSVKGGVTQVKNGVYQINERGVKVVAESGSETQLDVAQQYGLLRAEDRRAEREPFLYGTPISKDATTLVGGSSYVLMMDALDGRDVQTTFRAGLAGIVLLLAFGFGYVLKRRMRPRLVADR